MNDELASVKGIVDLPSHDALDQAQSFLSRQGYTTVRRAGNSLIVERRSSDQAAGQEAPRLTVSAVPQPGGGVRITVKGNDREGVQERQVAWVEWSESLPRKSETQADEPGYQQRTIEIPEVPLPPPPKVESADIPPSPSSYPSYAPTPRQGRRRWPWVVAGGCVVLPLLLIGFVGCLAVLGAMSGPPDVADIKGSGSGRTFTNDEYAELATDPDSFRGASVDVVGRVFRNPEVRGDETRFQMFADPQNSEWNTAVHTDAAPTGLKSGDYVRVQGVVNGSLEGQNAFGANVRAVEVRAESVEITQGEEQKFGKRRP